jgi:DNA-binding MarR family transcriptional regulator
MTTVEITTVEHVIILKLRIQLNARKGLISWATMTEQQETRWLTADEQATWRSFMLSTRLLFDQFERELQRSAGMPFQYYEVLVRLSESPDHSMRMSELADLSQSSRSRLSHAVSRLEDAGWVRRSSCASDRRGTTAVLTDAGMAVLEAAAPGHVASVRSHLFDQLTAEQLSQLHVISDALLRHLEAMGVSCGVLPPCPTGLASPGDDADAEPGPHGAAPAPGAADDVA